MFKSKLHKGLFLVLFLSFFQFFNAQCHYLIFMNDSYGDGWNDAYFEVSMNGVHTGDYSCDESFTLDSIYSFSGASMEFIFHSGEWDSEITFTILDPLGDTIIDGPAPEDLDNLLHTSNSTCAAPDCLNPSSLNASNVFTTSADLTWVQNSNDSIWNLNWGPADFTLGTANVINNLFSPDYSLSGLSSNTSYEFYVQVVCDSVNSSEWSGPYTFTTAFELGTCGAFSIELLDSYGDGWNDGYLDIEINGNYAQTITLLEGNGPEVFFVSVDSADVMNLIYNEGGWPEENSYNVYDHTGALITSQQGIPSSTYGLSACSQCASPFNLNAYNIDSTSADLIWDSYNDAGSSWNIEWGNAGFSQGTGSVVSNLSSVIYSLEGLNDDTDYEYYVQELCDNSFLSTWTGPFSFTTLSLSIEPGSCGMFSLLMYDSYGDGWNGGSIDIQINGTVTQNVTLSSGNGPGIVEFSVDSSDVIDIIYVTGQWDEENSYEVFDNDNILVAYEDGATSPNDFPGNSYGLVACQEVGTHTCGMLTLELYDAYGNGWNDGYISIEVDSVLIDTMTLEEGFGPAIMSFGVDSTEIINLIYHHPIPHSQNSYLDGYKLLDDQGNILIEEIGLDSTGPESTYNINLCPVTTLINDLALNEIGIYPNPAKNWINIKSKEQIDHVLITNILGEIVYELTSPNNNIDVSKLPSNLYFIRFKIKGKVTTRKLQITH